MNKVVTFGEIMLRLSPQNQLRFSQANNFNAIYGGGESNVAVSLANYGIPVEYVTRVPKNDIADCAIMEMRKHNVGTNNVIYGGERLGIYFLEIGAVTRGAKVVYDRAYSSMSTIQPGMIDWDKAFEGANWFHWTGITPSLSQSAADALAEAIDEASKRGINISCDLNYRAKLWNYTDNPGAIMEPMVAKTDVVLGNEEDAEKFFNIHPEGFDVTQAEQLEASSYLSVCKQMMAKFPNAKKIITTLRGSISASHNTWAGVLYNGKELLTSKQYNITHIVDRVGGGDSFMGGLIFGLLEYDNDQTALEFAVAASCIKHTIFGDANLATREEVEKLMGGDASGRVAR
jgi:2-dehydro-3-deoxygluconokinase